MRNILPVVLLAFLLLTSCATVHNDGDRPSWIDSPPAILFSTVIVGEGEGGSEEEAEAEAYLSILSQISSRTGVDYTATYYEELSSTGMISAFDTVITSKYNAEEDGVFRSYMLSTTDTVLLDEVSSSDYSVLLEREEKVKSKVDESLSYYRDNKDVKAINSLLEAVEISLEGEVMNESYSTRVLVERLEKYVSQIKFEFLGRSRKTGWEPGFRIYRDKGVMHPSIENADVIVKYPSLNADGEVIVLSYDAMSDEDGLIIVNKTNAYSLKKGTMTITINVDEDVISRIDEKAGDSLLSSFRSLLDNVVLSAEYSEEETYKPGEAIIALALYDYDGTSVDITDARETVSEMCSLLSIENVEIVAAEGDDEEEALEYLREVYSSTDVIYMVRIGIVDRVYTLGTWYTKTEGKIIRIDNRAGTSEEYKTMQNSSANDGESADDSKALENQIRLTCGFVLGEF